MTSNSVKSCVLGFTNHLSLSVLILNQFIHWGSIDPSDFSLQIWCNFNKVLGLESSLLVHSALDFSQTLFSWTLRRCPCSLTNDYKHTLPLIWCNSKDEHWANIFFYLQHLSVNSSINTYISKTLCSPLSVYCDAESIKSAWWESMKTHHLPFVSLRAYRNTFTCHSCNSPLSQSFFFPFMSSGRQIYSEFLVLLFFL